MLNWFKVNWSNPLVPFVKEAIILHQYQNSRGDVLFQVDAIVWRRWNR